MREAQNWLPARLGERVERRSFHLDREDILGTALCDRAGGLAKWRIGRPRGAAVDRFGQARKDPESAAGQGGVRLGKFRRRQVMVARTFIPKGTIDQHEIGGWPAGDDLTGRGHADQKAAAGYEELFREQHRKRGADRAADDAETLGAVVELVEIGVVARPAW